MVKNEIDKQTNNIQNFADQLLYNNWLWLFIFLYCKVYTESLYCQTHGAVKVMQNWIYDKKKIMNYLNMLNLIPDILVYFTYCR